MAVANGRAVQQEPLFLVDPEDVQEYTPEEKDRIERTDVGASIQLELTRGTGTRDQDKFRIKGKGESSIEAITEFEHLLGKFEDEWADRVRDIQPEESEE